MYIYYQIGIFVGLVFVALAINIFRQAHKSGYPSNLVNCIFSITISTAGICIIVASLAAIQPQSYDSKIDLFARFFSFSLLVLV